MSRPGCTIWATGRKKVKAAVRSGDFTSPQVDGRWNVTYRVHARRATGRPKMACVAPCFHGGTVARTPCAGLLPSWFRRGPGGGRAIVAQGSLSSLAAIQPCRDSGGAENGKFSDRLAQGAARDNSDYLVCGAATTRTAGKAAGPDRGPCATMPPQSAFSWPRMPARPSAVGGRLAAPRFRIHHAERRVGQALPLHLVIAFTHSNGA
jgi:hypothetical protein